MINEMFSHPARCGHELSGPFRDHIFMNPMNHRFLLLLIIAGIIIFIIIKFSVAWLVYKDATEKNIDNKKVWFFIVFFTSILGGIFYFLLVIYQHKNNVQSNASNNANVAQSSLPNVNQTFSANYICKNCGTEGDGKFCSKCGTRFS